MPVPVTREEKKEFHHMHLHPAESKDSASGVVSHTTYRAHAPGQGGGPAVKETVEIRHHKNREDFDAHIDEHMGHLFGEDADRAEADGELHRPGHNERRAGERG